MYISGDDTFYREFIAVENVRGLLTNNPLTTYEIISSVSHSEQELNRQPFYILEGFDFRLS
jgi:hypothetical protein